MTDLTGDVWAAGRPARAKETRRAPKLWPTRWNRTAGRALLTRPICGPKPALPMVPARFFICRGLGIGLGTAVEAGLAAVPPT